MNEFWLTKILHGLAGLFGASAIGSRYVPPDLRGKSPVRIALTLTLTSVFFSVVASPHAIAYFGLDANDPNVNIAIGALMGVVGVIFPTLLANSFRKKEDKSLEEVAKDVLTREERSDK